MKGILIRSPFVILRGRPPCAVCGDDLEDARHLTAEECEGGLDGGTCPDSTVHHVFRTGRPVVRRWKADSDWYLE